jgi:uncharacterized protein (UPF0335 family)
VDEERGALDRAAWLGLLKLEGFNTPARRRQVAMAGPASFAKEQLRSIVERIERLEEEKQAIAEDIKEVYAEAKANGYDTKTLRAVVRIRKQDTAERQEQEALLDLYLAALGMAAATPTAEAAE